MRFNQCYCGRAACGYCDSHLPSCLFLSLTVDVNFFTAFLLAEVQVTGGREYMNRQRRIFFKHKFALWLDRRFIDSSGRSEHLKISRNWKLELSNLAKMQRTDGILRGCFGRLLYGSTQIVQVLKSLTTIHTVFHILLRYNQLIYWHWWHGRPLSNVIDGFSCQAVVQS